MDNIDLSRVYNISVVGMYFHEAYLKNKNRNISQVDECPNLPYEVSNTYFNMMELYKKWNFDDLDGGVWKQGNTIKNYIKFYFV